MRAKKWEWKEGKVDPSTTHLELSYGDPALPVALVAKPVGTTFTVDFLPIPRLDQDERERLKSAVMKELTFYLVELGEKDPWG